MPHELEKKLDLELTMDERMMPVRIDGYDSLAAVLGRIQQKEEYRKQLLASLDTARFRAEWRDWWRLNDFLPRGVKLEARTPLAVDAINKTLETLKVDSARFDGPRPRRKKSCLEYTVYYHRTDSLTLLMEQFYFSSIQNRKYRKYDWHASVSPGRIAVFRGAKHRHALLLFQNRILRSRIAAQRRKGQDAGPSLPL